MANVRRDREISRLQGSQAQNWTNWVKAMVPPNTKGNNLEARGQGQVGSICTNIRSAFMTRPETVEFMSGELKER